MRFNAEDYMRYIQSQELDKVLKWFGIPKRKYKGDIKDIMMNYQLYTTIEKELSYERIGQIKRKLQTLVDKPPEGFGTKFKYQGIEFTSNLAPVRSHKTILVNEDNELAKELDKWIQILNQLAKLKQLFIQAALKVASTSYQMEYLLGINKGEYLDDESQVALDSFNEDNPELRKLYRKMKLMAGSV